MSASGNVRTTQLRSGDRHGNSTQVQISDGTGTTGNVPQYDANGNLIDSGKAASSISGGGAGSIFFPDTAPPTSSWSWFNQNSAVETSVRSALAYTIPQKNGTGYTVRYRTLPGSTFTVIAKISANIMQTSFYHHGICITNSDRSKAIFCGYAGDSTLNFRYTEWSDPNTIGGTVDVAVGTCLTGMQVYFKLVQDASNIIAYFGDGNQWYQLQTGGKTAFLTADQIGLLFMKNNSLRTYDYPTLISWVESTP